MKAQKLSVKNLNRISGMFPGRNFMTPHKIDFYETKKFYVELSERSLMEKKLYGVTVKSKRKDESSSLSTLKFSLKEAKEYIDSLDSLTK